MIAPAPLTQARARLRVLAAGRPETSLTHLMEMMAQDARLQLQEPSISVAGTRRPIERSVGSSEEASVIGHERNRMEALHGTVHTVQRGR